MALVVGLGNPGRRYARTRHNLGWRVVEVLARRWGARPGNRLPPYRSWSAEPGGTTVHLLVPLTFMNLSGAAVAAWKLRHGLVTDELLVVADDVYLPLGTLRMRREGSSGGHRGLASIAAVLGGGGYARLRIGAGAAASSEALPEHVLDTFEKDEEAVVEEVLELAADAVECWARDGATAAMNRFNRRVRREDSTP